MYISLGAPENPRHLVARKKAAECATGSLAAESLRPTPASGEDADACVRGVLSAEEMAARALARHRPEAQQAAE
ncbi:antitoxin VbhA family protein [Streptomyces sp. NPDC097640]|uniref:antitoxin VbhA family protein n=1 Tax=Streptomyces sp. NPDC097640 TaxID=3157229 RepID=UPI0033250D7C